jgi:hypothetical protein
MALTTNNLIASVNLEMQIHERPGSATSVGDGASTVFIVAPLGGYIIDDAVWEVAFDGVVQPKANYTMNFDSGVCTFVTAPALNVEVGFAFNYTPYNHTVVEQAVSSAVDSLFPFFYSEKIDDTITSADFVDNELSIPNCEAVIGFMTNSGTSWARTPRKNYEFYNSGGTPVLRFFSGAPTATKMRLHYIARPTVGELPDRASSPIVSYACYYMLLQKTAARTRSDIAIVTQGTGTLSPRQLNDAANAFYLRYQMQLATLKMRPWSTV